MRNLFNSKNLPVVLTLALAALIVLAPQLAFAQDAKSMIAKKGNDAFNLAYTIVYSVLGLGLLGTFAMASFGRLDWSRVGSVVAGIVGCGMVTGIVQYFAS